MGFGILWTMLSPLLAAALKVLLPWLVERITEDVKAGRKTTISAAEVKQQMTARKDAIRAVYQGREN